MAKRKRTTSMRDIKKVARLFEGDQLVIVTLENCTDTCSVQKALLCSASRYFVKALNNDFREGKTMSLTLPGCDKDTFEVFLYWLTKRHLPDSREMVESLINREPPDASQIVSFFEALEKDRKVLGNTQEILLIKTWAFGDTYMISNLQNAAMHRLVDLYQTVAPGAEALKTAFLVTSNGAALRKMIILQAAWTYRQKLELGKRTYSEEEMDTLGSTPGVMSAFSTALTGSYTTKFWCNGPRLMKDGKPVEMFLVGED